MNKVFFIYNPLAGTARIKKNIYEIVSFYEERGYIVTLCSIENLYKYPEDLLLETDSYDLIVCSGGDGTLNSVVSLFSKKQKKIKLAYVPAGSTNDVARSLEIPGDFEEALSVTLTGKPHPMDIGKFQEDYFVYVAAFGAFTKTSYATPQKAKNYLGHTAYLLQGVKEISELKSHKLKVIANNEIIEGSFILGMITNSFSVGGFKNIVPDDVSLSDGIFEIILIEEPQNLMELHEIVTSLLSGKKENKHIIRLKSSQIKFISEEVLEWTLDGEYGGEHTEVNVINCSGILEVIS